MMSAPEELLQSPSEEATLNSRGYRFIRKLGHGSYATVFLSEYSPVGGGQSGKTYLACKIVNTMKAPKDFVQKFLPRELEILVKLNHPNVIHVHSIFQRRAKYYIFMRYAENGDLLDFVLKNGAVIEAQARIWFRQMALGVKYIHDMDIVHRDLKCENILISANYNIKLADFGFARYIVDERGRRQLSETYCGSLSYAAPEILRGSPYNPKLSDAWSLGVILYIMLNKAMPFEDGNVKRLYEQQVTRRWKFRSKYETAVSEQVRMLVAMILEPDISRRLSVPEILGSEWIEMDPHLMVLTATERMNNANVSDERGKKLRSAVLVPKPENPIRQNMHQQIVDDMIFIKMAGRNPNPTPSRNIMLQK